MRVPLTRAAAAVAGSAASKASAKTHVSIIAAGHGITLTRPRRDFRRELVSSRRGKAGNSISVVPIGDSSNIIFVDLRKRQRASETTLAIIANIDYRHKRYPIALAGPYITYVWCPASIAMMVRSPAGIHGATELCSE